MNPYETLHAFRRILCICPCCKGIVRVSDLHLKTKDKVAKTWLDDFEGKELKLLEKEQKFEEVEQKLREKAREEGRKQAEKAIETVLSPEFKSLRLDPFDVKPLLHPVDFLVFEGMNKEEVVDSVVLMSRRTTSPSLEKVRSQIGDLVSNKKYEWRVIRVLEDGNLKFER